MPANCKHCYQSPAVPIHSAVPAIAAESHSTPPIEKQSWSFAGIFGTYDQNQLQRGFKVYQKNCSSCHGMEGGRIRLGTQVGRVTGPDSIELLYQCLTLEGELLAGDAAMAPAAPEGSRR